MATANTARALARPSSAPTPKGITEASIEGGFRKITTHQLVMAWWLYERGAITRRQLRVWFALHEMAERRECAAKGDPETRRRAPSFALEEVLALVGGRGAPKAQNALAGDLRRLEAIGLAAMSQRRIAFAVSADQLRVSDLSGFWAMLARIPNASRSVPVPRRLLRALAGGFSRAVMAVIIATLIRSLFWHRESGAYRVDGRTKGSWIAETFNVSRRAVTDAKAHLVDLGWLQSIDAPQWALNRWGAHDAINAAWSEKNSTLNDTTEIASPSRETARESASPFFNSSPSPSEKDLHTRNPARPDLAGVSSNDKSGKANSALAGATAPDLRCVEAAYLENAEILLQLHAQAVERGLIENTEASVLDFFAYAERARARGSRPGALFVWLLAHRKREFISAIDDERAAERLREHRNKRAGDMRRASTRPDVSRELTEDERFYLLCLKIARQQRVEDPFRIAFIGRQWTRDHWEAVKTSCELYDRSRWVSA